MQGMVTAASDVRTAYFSSSLPALVTVCVIIGSKYMKYAACVVDNWALVYDIQ